MMEALGETKHALTESAADDIQSKYFKSGMYVCSVVQL